MMQADPIVEVELPEIGGALRDRLAPWLERAVDLGMVGGSDPEDHVRHARGMAAAAEHVLGGQPQSFLDLGSGGGLPAMVLLAVWPTAGAYLIEASERRADFLADEISALGWSDRAAVRRGRAEEVGHDPLLREQFPVVTARSFGPPAVTAECGAPFLVPGGMLVVAEPPAADPEVRWPRVGVATVGLARGPLVRCGSVVTLQVLTKVRPSEASEPRGIGRPAKRPKF